MYRWMTTAGVVVVATLAMASSAMAWNGGQITSVSCPEIHLRLPVENGKWQVWATDDQGKTVYSVQVPGASFEQVVGGFYMPDNATHTGYVYAANAANMNDGKVKLPYQLTGCASPIGTPGPPGPTGPPGPAGPPGVGTPGAPGQDATNTNTTKTVEIHVAPRDCTSKRSYSFRVRRSYAGSKIVSVTASEPGIKVNVTKRNGRFVVSWSTSGKHYTHGGVVRSVTVLAKVAGRKLPVRLQWDYRPCMGPDGNLNDPSAAGQGTSGV